MSFLTKQEAIALIIFEMISGTYLICNIYLWKISTNDEIHYFEENCM